MRNFWDFAWEEPAPFLFVQYDVDGASYTGAARHSAEYYAQLLAQGTEVLGIMETNSTASQGGYNVGMQFVQFARQRWREVGFPDSAPMAYALSDGSRWDPNYGWDQIAACGEGIGDYEVGPYKFYGNRYAVDAGCEGAARSLHPELCLNLHGGWVPRTWDFDASRDTAAQEIGGTPVGGIDVNTTYRPIFGAPAPPPPPDPEPEEGTMLEVVQLSGPFGPIARLVTGDGAILEQWVGGEIIGFGVMADPYNQRPSGTPYRVIHPDQVDQAIKFIQWSDAATARVGFH